MDIREKTKNNFKQIVNCGRLPHAILIEGGSEKSRIDIAWFFAETLICAGEEKPCGFCKDCLKVKEKVHPDIIEISGGEGARSFHVDEIRRIKNEAYIVPNESSKKVFLLVKADTMSEQAQNALLKILEEPPEYAAFILTCNSRISLLPTVISRVTAFDLGPSEEEETANEKTVKARSIVSAFVHSLNAINELDLLRVTGELEKEKQLLNLCVLEMTEVIRDAVIKKSGGNGTISPLNEDAEYLALNFTKIQLMKMMEVLNGLKILIEKNANNNILITRLCSEMREASGK